MLQERKWTIADQLFHLDQSSLQIDDPQLYEATREDILDRLNDQIFKRGTLLILLLALVTMTQMTYLMIVIGFLLFLAFIASLFSCYKLAKYITRINGPHENRAGDSTSESLAVSSPLATTATLDVSIVINASRPENGA